MVIRKLNLYFHIALILLFTTNCSISRSFFSDQVGLPDRFQDLRNKKVVVMITSLSCGFCLLNTPYFNELSTTFSDRVEFIAFYEDDSVAIRKSKFLKLNWEIVSGEDKRYQKFWKKGIYPEIQIYDAGVLLQTYSGISERTKIRLKSTLNRISQE